MLNAASAALHLLNIREEFFFSLFYSECFVIWKILVFVSIQSVKVAPQKTLRMLPQRFYTIWILIV